MCCGTEAGSYLRLIDSCITHLKAQGPSRTCNESKEEEVSHPMRSYFVHWKREFKLPWREAGPPNHHDDKVDSDAPDVALDALVLPVHELHRLRAEVPHAPVREFIYYKTSLTTY